MSRGGRGLAYGATSYVLWGLFPLFWPLLEPANPLEILASRITFSLLSVALVVAAGHRLGALARADRGLLIRLGVAGAVVSVNWGAYIWGVNNGHVVETSLGYFINPIVTVGLGVVLLHERLRAVQWAAVGLGVVAVLVLSVDYGRPPWLALLLAVSFGTYGLIKNRVRVGAPDGLLVETAAMVLPALAVLAALAAVGDATWVGRAATPGHLLLLVAAGPVTAIPLLFFAGAASRLPLSTMGLLQYLAPVMQFTIGILVRHEAMPPARLGGFALVWLALAILTTDAVRHRGRMPPPPPEPALNETEEAPVGATLEVGTAI